MAAATKVVKAFKPPKNLAECADLMGETKKERLALAKQVKELEKKEIALKKHLIEMLPISKAEGISGRKWNAKIMRKWRPQVDDIKKLHAWIKRTGDFGVLNQAVNKSHLEELWNDKKTVPGVSKFDYKSISLTKV